MGTTVTTVTKRANRPDAPTALVASPRADPASKLARLYPEEMAEWKASHVRADG